LIHGKQSKQPGAFRQLGEQGFEIMHPPTVQLLVAYFLQRKQDPQGHHFTWLQVGLRMFRDVFLHVT
jgi:hypothetical protein